MDSSEDRPNEDRAVIFDMDGVLIDSYEAHFLSWRVVADQLGDTFTREDFAATFGRTSREIIGECWAHRAFSQEEIQRLDDAKEAAYREIVEQRFPEMEGVGPLLDALHAAGMRLAIGSSGPVENVALVVQRLGEERFDATVSSADVMRGKPDPEVFVTAAQRLGLPASRCVVIEDAPAGIQAARAAGMRCVGLASTGRTAEQLAAADRVVHSLTELDVATLDRLIAG